MGKEDDEGKNRSKQDMDELLVQEMLRSMKGETDDQDGETGKGRNRMSPGISITIRIP